MTVDQPLESIARDLRSGALRAEALADRAILAARHQTYLQARERHPARWSRGTRDWTPIGAVTLNPERDAVVRDHIYA